uniref:Uncharacterized protein n=1 Tax=Zea mays TaxID=4577 RepID=A0A804MYP0_MAIZE
MAVAQAISSLQVRLGVQLFRSRWHAQASTEQVPQRRRDLGVVGRVGAAVRQVPAAPRRGDRLGLEPRCCCGGGGGVGQGGVHEGVRRGGGGEVERDGGAGRGGGDHGGGAEKPGGGRQRVVLVAVDERGRGGGGGGSIGEHGHRRGGRGRHGRRRRRERVVVRAIVRGDQDRRVLRAPLHLLPHRAVRRHRAAVVGARARVPLGDLLPVLPPLAAIGHLMIITETKSQNNYHIYACNALICVYL